MANQPADGYTVDTTAGLRGFRDGTLTNLAGGLPDLGQVIAAAGLDLSAFPAVVRDAAHKRGMTLDAMLDKVKNLTETAGDHIAGLTRAAGTYEGAESASTAAVTGNRTGSASSTGAGPAAMTGVSRAAPAVAATTSGQSDPASIIALYRRLEAMCGALGLASLVHPIGALIAANVRDPRPFGQAADRLRDAHTSATALHQDVPEGLDALSAQWSGQAHDAHWDATMTAYQPHLADLREHTKNLAEKDWQSQEAQQRFNHWVTIVLAVVLAVVIVADFTIAVCAWQRGAVGLALAGLLLGFATTIILRAKVLKDEWP
jgi:uncharacterized protein YukE